MLAFTFMVVTSWSQDGWAIGAPKRQEDEERAVQIVSVTFYQENKLFAGFPNRLPLKCPWLALCYTPHPPNTSCKGDWEREYLAGHVATLNKTRIMLAKKREIDLG